MTSPQQSPWWQTGVVYQVYPRSFQDTTGDGVGDLPGVIDRLDHLAGVLGVDAVWLSPFFRSPMRDFGYDVSDYCDVDPLFGTLDDADRLIAAAHERGLAVVVDFVPNHTSDEHPWFQESRSSRSSPKRDWYVWRDPAPDGSPPNNWLSVFGGPAWEWDETTGQYYLHSFLASQPDLDWRNPDVEDAMHGVLRFWLDRGVDGFRMDVVHFVMKDPGMRDNPANPDDDRRWLRADSDYDAWQHVHDQNHPDVHPVLRRMRSLLEEYPGDRLSIGEVHVPDLDDWATFHGDDLDELHQPFNFSLMRSPWTAENIRARVDAVETALPAGAWPNHVLGNHDEPRLNGRIPARQLRAAAVLLLTLRGTPTLYYGDELGLPDGDVPEELRQDTWALQTGVWSRDHCRIPMPWEGDSEHAGFSPPGTPETWLPIPATYRDLAVDRQLDDPGSLLNLYRRLLRLRRDTPALHSGDYRRRDDAPNGCLVYERRLDDDRILVAINFTPEERPTPTVSGSFLVTTGEDRPGEVDGPLELQPDEAVVLRLHR